MLATYKQWLIIKDVNFEHVISKSSSIKEFEEHLLNLYLDNKYISNQLNKAFNKYEALN